MLDGVEHGAVTRRLIRKDLFELVDGHFGEKLLKLEQALSRVFFAIIVDSGVHEVPHILLVHRAVLGLLLLAHRVRLLGLEFGVELLVNLLHLRRAIISAIG